MEGNIAPRPLISDFLLRTNAEVASKQVKVSDGLLPAIRIARIFFTDSRLSPLTNELLGYSCRDSSTEIDAASRSGAGLVKAAQANQSAHRLLNGFSVPLFALIQQRSQTERPRVKTECHFCSLPTSEIELLVERAAALQAPYLVVEYDENTNRAFVCKTAELQAVLERIDQFVHGYLEQLVVDLQQIDPAADGKPAKRQPNAA